MASASSSLPLVGRDSDAQHRRVGESAAAYESRQTSLLRRTPPPRRRFASVAPPHEGEGG